MFLANNMILGVPKDEKKQSKQFWDKYANKSKTDKKGAHSDKNLVALEDEFVYSVLKKLKPKSLLDIGCGNGQRTVRFSKFVKGKTLGIDFSENMIKQCKPVKEKVSFECVNASEITGKFDVIVSCRCMINILSKNKQLQQFKIIHDRLNKNGSLIIVEGSKQGYSRMNALRKKFKLDHIKVVWHNLALDEDFLFPKISKIFKTKQINRLGMYYFLTRVINPCTIYPQKPDPESKLNNVSLKAEQLFDNVLDQYGAHLLVHFQKI